MDFFDYYSKSHRTQNIWIKIIAIWLMKKDIINKYIVNRSNGIPGERGNYIFFLLFLQCFQQKNIQLNSPKKKQS